MNNMQIGFAPDLDIDMVLALANGLLTEAEVAMWFRERPS